MKRSAHLLVIGCVLGALALSPPEKGEAAPALAFVSGTVKADGGEPLAGALVALLEARHNGREVKTVRTDAGGRFTAGITPGVYRLRASADGFKPMFTRVILDRSATLTYDFALKRDNTLVQKRGDRADYRWIGRSAPRQVLHLEANGEEVAATEAAEDSSEAPRGEAHSFFGDTSTFHGMVQFVASGRTGSPGANFYGTNFALASSFGGNFEMAIVGQGGVGALAPQRLSAIATVRPSDNHQITTSVEYGSVVVGRRMGPMDEQGVGTAFNPSSTPGRVGRTLEQISVTTIGEWHVFRPLIVIYGFDYARFLGATAKQNESILPRLAFQYAPSRQTRLKGSFTPGSSHSRPSAEAFETEDLQIPFEAQSAEIAGYDNPILDRSYRYEMGFERIFGEGRSSLETAVFYDVIAGHGLGVLALPLEDSPETQATMRQVARQVAALNGTARGVRVSYAHHLSDHLTASVGYSFGRGSRFDQAPIETLAPAQLFDQGYFQVAAAKLDLDLTEETGTRVSTVVRLSPAAVIFAIDPFAGQMSVYDPNINIYVTQDLPRFGLPLRWQAIVDIRNLLNQLNGVDNGTTHLIAARSSRLVRGGVNFRW